MADAFHSVAGSEADKMELEERGSSLAPSAEPTRQASVTDANNYISLDDVEAVDVQVRDLTVTIDTAPSLLTPSTYPELVKGLGRRLGGRESVRTSKTLIQSVSLSLKAGTLTAILGGSGSGKTTLLNTMAERMIGSRLLQSGTTTFNGMAGVHHVRHAYVMQQDVLLPTLTVRETLRYSADLRLPASTSPADRHRVVEEVILELGLKDCADTRIGNHQHRGCSGGEKRRVSIGVQMLANPSVLFLDEPTSGLDAASAFQLVRTLKVLAAKGRTIVTTIHQPRSEIWDLFDSLVLMTKGRPVYSGASHECLAWLEDLGFPLPAFVNPAEFVIDVAAMDNRTPELELESSARVKKLQAAWRVESARRFEKAPAAAEATTGVSKLETRRALHKQASFGRQLRVMTDRTLKVSIRDPMGMGAAFLEAIVMGLVNGYIFFNLSRDQSGIRSREGALYTAAALQGYLFLVFETYRLTIDIPTFDREHSENCVGPLAFLLSRRLARLMTEDVSVPLLFSTIFYFMAGFEPEPAKFFVFFAIILVNHYIAVTSAMACVVAFRHFAGAALIANLNYTVQSMASGYLIQSNTIPVYTRWLKYVAYNYYTVGALCGNEFQGSFYDCPYDGGKANPSCAPYTGKYIMDSLGLPANWVWRPIVIMLAFVLFFYILSWLGFTFVRHDVTISRTRVSDKDRSAGKEKMTANSVAEVRSIDLALEAFTLHLEKRSRFGKKLPAKTILNPVTATFQSGVVNVIMGPSGSGKTSLLNAMALRLNGSIGTRYRTSGKLTLNGAEPSDAVIRSVCSYVCQDDDALLPSLTVRETLRYAAGLRLPAWMSADRKHERAEEVLLKMGLKDCADNLVGNDLVKGISGGEKRRVTIAVQILTDPLLITLDEPTTGLDAFTASSIMEVLQALAHEGRTVILTIHQARSDLFKHFGNVLLLARGGSPVYAGSAREMLGYFQSHGYECPAHTNPADFALDLITIDLQHQQREMETRARAKFLIQAWAGEVELPRKASRPGSVPRLPSMDKLPKIDENERLRHVVSNADNGLGRRTSLIPAPRLSLNKSAIVTPAELGTLVRKRTGFLVAFSILVRRATVNFLRQPQLLIARTMQVVGFGLILALFTAPLGFDFYSVQNRIGFVQQMGALYFVGMLQNVAVYPAERDVFYRESDDGVYGVEAFLASYTAIELPLELFSALLFAVLADLAVGLPRTGEMYGVTMFVCFCVVSCGESLGVMFNTLFGHTGFAVNLTSILLSVAQIMGGIMSIDMPALFRACNYLSPIHYAMRAFAPFSLRDIVFTCSDEQRLPSGECVIASGKQVLQLYKLDGDGAMNLAALAACMVVYRLLAWALLRAVRTRWKEEARLTGDGLERKRWMGT